MEDIKKKAHALPITTSIGKNGITDGAIEQVKRDLKEKKLIKVKILKTAHGQDREKRMRMARELSERTQSTLVQVVGNAVVLHKR